nr:retrotransposon protein, putative, Ty1-copia subclass [Tanacetum cinerariifolium]
EGKPVAAYVLQMKGYVDQLERLGYMLPQDLIVGLVLNGFTKDFAGFVRNYNKHNTRKTIGELHAMLTGYEKGLPKKDETPQVMMIKGGKIHKSKKKSLKVKGKGKANGKGNDKQVYIPKPKNPKHAAAKGFRETRKLKQGALYLYVGNGVRAQVEAIGSFDLVFPNGLVICLDNCHYAPSITIVSKNNVHYFNVILSNGIYEIDMHDLVPNDNSIYNVSTKRAKHNLDSTYLWHCRLARISKKCIKKLQHEGLLRSTDDESFDQCVSCLSGKMKRKSFPHCPGRVTDLFGIIHTDVCGSLRHVSRQESVTRIFNMVPTKKVDKTPYELWIPKGNNRLLFYFPPENEIVVVRYAEFFDKNLITQEVSGRAVDLEEIQDKDTSPSEITSEIPREVEGFEPPQEEVISIHRSERTHRAPNRLCLNVEVEEHNNMVWVLVDLPPNCKTVGSKCIFKKKTDMDGIVHTYKARLVAKGYTQLYGVDYEETFSPIADIRVIRILISIEAFYDYEIWKMDVKTSFLNGYLDEDIYMVQPEGFIDPNHPRKENQHLFFEIKIYRDRSKRLIGLGQKAYMDKILKRYKMDNSKYGHIPMQERLDLNKTQGASTPIEVKHMQNVPYASVVGSIMYAVRCTRPDVAFAQNITSRFQQNPGELHWTAVKNILNYSRTTKDIFLVYEAEYIDASEAAMEAVWIRKFISGLGIVPTINEPIRMFCDNSAGLHFANEQGVQRGARHYHRRYHYVRKSIALGEIRFFKVHTDDNLTDPFTKALSKGKLTQHARRMGLRLASSFMMRMEVLLGIHGVWDVVDPGSDDAKKNNIVKGLLFQLIPEDLVMQIGNLKNGKEMWEAIKTRNLGADRVKEARLQTLITEFKNLKMLDNDSIGAYAAKLSGIAFKSTTLGEVMSELKLGMITQAEAEDVNHTLVVVDKVEVKDVVGATRKTKYGHFVSKCPERNRNHEVNLNEAQEKCVYHEEGKYSYFSELNENITRRVRFEDGSCVSIKGKGSILFQATISGYVISIRGDFLTMRDSWESLLIKVPRNKNRLYKAQLKVGKEGTNKVGRESDEEVNLHSSSVNVHNPVHKTSLESEKDNSRRDDTPNPLVRLETIRVLIALAARKGWKIHHLDVITEFLNGDRKKLDSTLEEMGFLQCVHEKAVYRKVDSSINIGCDSFISHDDIATYPKKNDRQVRSSNFRVCGYKARVVFDMVVDTTEYVLTTFDVEHNHELDRVEYKHLSKAERKLTYNEQLFIIKAANANIGVVRAHNLYTGLKGSSSLVHGTQTEFKNSTRGVNCFIGDSDAHMLITRMEQRQEFTKDFSFDYFVEDAELCVVTDQDGAMRLAAEFPESKHRLCMWHIIQKIPAKILSRIYDDTDIKDKFEHTAKVYTRSLFIRVQKEIVAGSWLCLITGMSSDEGCTVCIIDEKKIIPVGLPK